MRPAGSGAGSSGSTGRWRGSTGPGSGSERVAGTAAGSTEAGSPTRAHETAAARWSRAPRERRSPAGTGASCGSRHRHAGPRKRVQRGSLKHRLSAEIRSTL